MFSKKQRLKRLEIGNIFKNPVFSFRSDNFILKGRPNNLPHSRFSIVVSKKTEQGAVRRHFLKRKIVSILKEFKSDHNLDLVLTLKNTPKETIKQELDNLLNKCIIVK